MTIRLSKEDVEQAATALWGQVPARTTAAEAVLWGQVPARMTAAEAAQEFAHATMFDREPDARAVAVRERVETQQEAFRLAAPWRAEVPWYEYDALVEAEERLAELWSTRRGQTLERARHLVIQLLREAWASPGAASDRHAAVVAERDHYTHYLQAQTPLVAETAPALRAPAAPATGRGAAREMRESDAGAALGRLFTRDGKEA